MKISLISPGSSPLPPAKCTSVEIYLSQIAKRLSRRHDVRLYAMGQSRPLQNSRLTIMGWGGKRTGRSYLTYVSTNLPRQEHTIVQIDNRPAYVPVIKQALGRSTIPLVLNLHSTTFIAPQMIRPSTLRSSFQQVDKIIVNSHYLYRTMAKQHPDFKNKLHVIQPGVDVKYFPSRNSKQGEKLRTQKRNELGVSTKTVLMFAGRFTPRKGIALLLKVFDKLVPRFPNLELWIVGGEPTDNSPFHRQIRSLSSGLPVRFFRYMPADHLHAFYLAADLFLCPSQLSEAFGMVNIEAAACGLPSLGSDAWGIRESIAEGISGWRVKRYNDVNAWAEQITGLLQTPERLQTVSKKARTWAESSFSWERVANDFAQLYTSLTRQKT